MRLIDADRLKEVFRRNTGHDYSELIDIQPTVDVLDKIRAEILKMRNEHRSRSVDYESISLFAEGLDKALRIIDKYREESEE